MGNKQPTQPQKSKIQVFDELTETQKVETLTNNSSYHETSKIPIWESYVLNYSCTKDKCDFTDALSKISTIQELTDNQRHMYKEAVELIHNHQERFYPHEMDGFAFNRYFTQRYSYKYGGGYAPGPILFLRNNTGAHNNTSRFIKIET
jgi:hypothetical protein